MNVPKNNMYIPFIKSLIFPSGNLTTQDILFRALVNSIISKTSYSTVSPFFSWTENRFEFQKLGSTTIKFIVVVWFHKFLVVVFTLNNIWFLTNECKSKFSSSFNKSFFIRTWSIIKGFSIRPHFWNDCVTNCQCCGKKMK